MDLSEHRHAVSVLQFVERERAKMAERERELKEIEAEAVAEIQEALGKNVEEASIDGAPVVSWRKGSQMRLNQRLLKERFPEIYEVCKTPVETRTWKVLV